MLDESGKPRTEFFLEDGLHLSFGKVTASGAAYCEPYRNRIFINWVIADSGTSLFLL